MNYPTKKIFSIKTRCGCYKGAVLLTEYHESVVFRRRWISPILRLNRQDAIGDAEFQVKRWEILEEIGALY